jgi:uncharacterized protein (DUF58 family)
MERLLTKRNTLLVLTLITFLVAWNREINLLYGMFALLASTLLLSYILPIYALRGIRAIRTVPATAFEDEAIEMKLTVGNSGWTRRYMIEVIDTFPAAELSLQHPMTFVAKLSGRKKRTYPVKTVCYKRGAYRIGPLKIESAYPLGVSSVERPMPEEAPTLLVYPKVFPIASLPLMRGITLPMNGVEAMSKGGGSEEFFGTREYRPGDHLKYIHWPSTARRAKLIVKEFEIRAATEVTILLDLHRNSSAGEGKETPLEYAVKISASVAQYALDRGHDLQLVGYGRNTHHLPPARGMTQLAAVLEALARVEADGNVPFPKAISQAAEVFREGGTAVLIFSRLDANIEEILEGFGLLTAKRIRPICIFINNESFLPKKPSMTSNQHRVVQEAIALGFPSYFISKGDRLEEVFV